MEKEKHSPKLLSVTPATMLDLDRAHREYARVKAAQMFGCFRTGQANDPDLYVAGIAAVLAEYPRKVIDYVTDPRTGLPRKSSFLPSIAEVSRACEEEMAPISREQGRTARQLEAKQLIENEHMAPEAQARVKNGFQDLLQRLKNGTLQKMGHHDGN